MANLVPPPESIMFLRTPLAVRIEILTVHAHYRRGRSNIQMLDLEEGMSQQMHNAVYLPTSQLIGDSEVAKLRCRSKRLRLTTQYVRS